jgi:hypothetical protein
MALFKYIETIFFASLAITFVLILMLVYHFKDRIFHLEKKIDTMFDIMNNVVKEMMVIKTQCAVSNFSAPLYNSSQYMQPSESNIHSVYIPPVTSIVSETVSTPSLRVDKIIVSDNDEDSDEDFDEDDEDEDFDDDFEEDDDDEVDESADPTLSVTEEIVDPIQEDEDLVKHDSIPESDPSSLDSSETIPEESAASIDSILSEIKQIEIPKESDIQIHVNEEEPMDIKKYSKMDIPALRTTLLQKGYINDTSKLKKKELIQLLSKL